MVFVYVLAPVTLVTPVTLYVIVMEHVLMIHVFVSMPTGVTHVELLLVLEWMSRAVVMATVTLFPDNVAVTQVGLPILVMLLTAQENQTVMVMVLVTLMEICLHVSVTMGGQECPVLHLVSMVLHSLTTPVCVNHVIQE